MTYIARTIDVTKVYAGEKVVSNVNMSIKQGEIYGFLGPNGAGNNDHEDVDQFSQTNDR